MPSWLGASVGERISSVSTTLTLLPEGSQVVICCLIHYSHTCPCEKDSKKRKQCFFWRIGSSCRLPLVHCNQWSGPSSFCLTVTSARVIDPALTGMENSCVGMIDGEVFSLVGREWRSIQINRYELVAINGWISPTAAENWGRGTRRSKNYARRSFLSRWCRQRKSARERETIDLQRW